MAIEIILNGEERRFDQLEPGASVDDLIAALGLKADRVALEHNGTIAPRTSWGTVLLSQNDRIELVHFVGGGSRT